MTITSIKQYHNVIDFVIATRENITMSCTFEDFLSFGEKVYLIFSDLTNKLYAYLIVSPYSDSPSLIEPPTDEQERLIFEYKKSQRTLYVV